MGSIHVVSVLSVSELLSVYLCLLLGGNALQPNGFYSVLLSLRLLSGYRRQPGTLQTCDFVLCFRDLLMLAVLRNGGRDFFVMASHFSRSLIIGSGVHEVVMGCRL